MTASSRSLRAGWLPVGSIGAVSVVALILLLAGSVAAASPAELEAALAPHGWMAAQPQWPCRYRGHFEQTRLLGTRKLPSSGRFFEDCNDGLLWRVERPVDDVSVYARGGKFLRLQRGGSSGTRVTLIDGLAERRVGRLLNDLFAGDVAALDRDFAHAIQSDGSVRLTPRDKALAARLDSIDLSGDASSTEIRVWVPAGDELQPLLEMQLHDFALAEGDDGCADTFEDGNGKLDGCDALRYPARWLQRARNPSR